MQDSCYRWQTMLYSAFIVQRAIIEIETSSYRPWGQMCVDTVDPTIPQEWRTDIFLRKKNRSATDPTLAGLRGGSRTDRDVSPSFRKLHEARRQPGHKKGATSTNTTSASGQPSGASFSATTPHSLFCFVLFFFFFPAGTCKFFWSSVPALQR